MRILAAFTLASALLVCGCSQAAANDRPDAEEAGIVTLDNGAQPSRAATLERVVSPDILGSNSSFVENLLGQPARHTALDGMGVTRNTYEIGDCTLHTGVVEGRVVSVRLNLIPGVCDIDVRELLGRPASTMASSTTYGDWSTRGALHFTDLQMPSCNACWESYPYALIDGTSAQGSFDILLNGMGDWGRADVWHEAVRRSGLDLESLPNTGRGCPLRAFDEIGSMQMGATRVDTIEFGRRDAVQPACSARPVQMRRGEDTYLWSGSY